MRMDIEGEWVMRAKVHALGVAECADWLYRKVGAGEGNRTLVFSLGS